MKIDLNVYFHSTAEDIILSKLVELLNVVTKQGKHMAQDLTNLATKVSANSDVIDSAVTLLNGIKAKLDEAIAANDPAALQALSDALAADTQELADAVVKNTPAE